MNVEIYSRPGCHLCEQAKAVLLQVQQEIPFELLEVDIERDPLLLERFKTEIPVVFVDGRKLSHHKVDVEALRNRLERARSFSMGTLDPQKTLSRTAPVSRGTKTVFAVVAVLAIAGVFASKGYTKFVLDRQRALEGLELVAQDRPAPDFSVEAPGGKVRTISGYQGKLLVLNFFATWCGPCREEMPSMEVLARQVKAEGISVLAVDEQEDWATINSFFSGKTPSFDLALDASGAAAEAYELRPQGKLMFPETFIVTPKGRVVAKFEGPRDWTDATLVRYLRSLARG